MREIKFRAWDKFNKKMCEVIDLLFSSSFVVVERDKIPMIEIAFDLVELLQFTGLLDKNGKEIYEGDIVKDIIGGELYIIKWSKDWAQFTAEKIKNMNLTMDLIYSDHFEVIGNVFESPELLKEVK